MLDQARATGPSPPPAAPLALQALVAGQEWGVGALGWTLLIRLPLAGRKKVLVLAARSPCHTHNTGSKHSKEHCHLTPSLKAR